MTVQVTENEDWRNIDVKLLYYICPFPKLFYLVMLSVYVAPSHVQMGFAETDRYIPTAIQMEKRIQVSPLSWIMR